jgi:hypothetical protein
MPDPIARTRNRKIIKMAPQDERASFSKFAISVNLQLWFFSIKRKTACWLHCFSSPCGCKVSWITDPGFFSHLFALEVAGTLAREQVVQGVR